MITDWSGISIEYALITKRPVIFINTPKKINNKFFNDIKSEPIEIKIREKIGIVIEESDLLNIDNYLKKLTEKKFLKNKLKMKKKN